jgi:uncharacterized protein YndB with AHSA1/START domain
MRSLITLSTMVLVLLAAAAASGQEVTNTSYVAPDGSRVLRQSIEVPASILEVWQALTTTEGVRSWAVPVAAVDFRPGGIWESSYRLDGRIGDPGNIKNRILSYLPLRMLSIQAIQAPPNFPHPELLPEIFTVFESEELGPASTRVTVSMVEYREGEGYDVLYRHFERGNAWSLQQLRKRFVEGPVDWAKVLGSQAGRQ